MCISTQHFTVYMLVVHYKLVEDQPAVLSMMFGLQNVFLVLHHKCYPIMFLEIVCSMIDNLQSQKCSCVKQMPRSVLIGEFLIVSINIQLHTMNLSINNGPVKPRNFISYHKDFTALGDTGKSFGNDDILI